MTRLISDDESSDNDDELYNDSSSHAIGSKSNAPSVLPKKFTQELGERIKKLAEMWAAEERMATGANVFQWQIINGDTILAVASQVPITVEELPSIDGGLGENFIKEHGERLVKNIKAHIEQNDLQEYLDRRPAAKRPRTEGTSGKPDAKKDTSPEDATIG